jgi:hypothetical protein
MRPYTPAHAKLLVAVRARIARAGLRTHAEAIESLIRPAIQLETTKLARGRSLAVGASRIGGASPDLPDGVRWPERNGAPLEFVLQVNLADAAPFDLEGSLPPSGLLSVFGDLFGEAFTVMHFPAGTGLVRRARPSPAGSRGRRATPAGPEAALECRPALQLPPPSSCFVGLDAPATVPGSARRPGLRSVVALPRAAFSAYWNGVAGEYPARRGPAGRGRHAMLGYASGTDDGGEQGAHEVRLLAIDSDDTLGLQWGDVQTAQILIEDRWLALRRFEKSRTAY